MHASGKGESGDDETADGRDRSLLALTEPLERAPVAAWIVSLPDRRVLWQNIRAEGVGGPTSRQGAHAEDALPANAHPDVSEALDAFERGEALHRCAAACCPGTDSGDWELTWEALDREAPKISRVLVYARRLPSAARWHGVHADVLAPPTDPVHGEPVVALLTDGSGDVLSLTDAACRQLGRPSARLLGARLPELLRDQSGTCEDLLQGALEASGRPVSGWVTVNGEAGGGPVPAKRVAMAVISRLGEPPVDALVWHKLPIEEPPINSARKAHTSEYAAFLERRLSEIAKEVERAGLVVRSHGAPPARLLPGLERLSDREREVLDLLARGLRVPTIAERLFVSQSTVRNHVSALFRKLGVQSQAELIERVLDPEDRPAD